MVASVPRSLAISNLRTLKSETTAEWAGALAAAGVDALQLREKELSDRQLFELALELAGLELRDTTLIVNQRVDIALAVGAGGLHLRSSSVSAVLVRERYPSLLVGKSAHSLDDVRRARDDGVHYVVFGPVFEPRSKVPTRTAVGLAGLEQASLLGLPVLALGGMALGNLGQVARAGATGIAAISLFQDLRRRCEILERIQELWPPDGKLSVP